MLKKFVYRLIHDQVLKEIMAEFRKHNAEAGAHNGSAKREYRAFMARLEVLERDARARNTKGATL